MTKATAALGTLGLGATTAVATPLALKYGSNGSSEKVTGIESATLLSSSITDESFPELSWSGQKIPKLASSKDVSKEYKEIECLKSYFNEGEEWKNGKYSFPHDLTIEKDSISKSCLVVEYHKQTYNNDKWWGEFKFIWSWSNDKQGFITSFNAKTNRGGLKIDSSLYVVKKDNQNKWILDYKQENPEKTISNKTGLTNVFPKPSTTIITNSNNYWDFNPEPEKICKSNECTETQKTETKQSFIWNWKKDGGNSEINDWCTNLQEWFVELSPNGDWEKIKNSIKNLKGTWTKQ